MLIGRNIIHKLLMNEGDFERAAQVERIFELEQGVDWQAWQFVKEHYGKHGKVPTMEIFRQNFPEAILHFGHVQQDISGDYKDAEESFSELLEQAVDRVFNADMGQMIGSVLDLHDQDKNREALEVIRNFEAGNSTLLRQDDRHESLINCEDLEDLPDPEYLIESMIELGAVTQLEGAYGSGKSFLAFDWACCIASGKSWIGHPVQQQRVLYVAAEGGKGYKKRFKAWKQHNSPWNPKKNLDLYIKPLQILDNGDFNWLTNLVASEDYGVVFIDTQARCTVGVDENSAKEMGIYVDRLFKLRDASGPGLTTIVNVHHQGWDKGHGRGSTAVPSGADAIFTLEAKSDDPHVMTTLKHKKTKDAAMHDDIYLVLEEKEEADSCVLVETERVETDKEHGPDRQIVLELLERPDGITSPELQVTLDWNQTKANRVLQGLAKEELAVLDGRRG